MPTFKNILTGGITFKHIQKLTDSDTADHAHYDKTVKRVPLGFTPDFSMSLGNVFYVYTIHV